jgi:tetratricopeptide (TPR) repeat protein
MYKITSKPRTWLFLMTACALLPFVSNCGNANRESEAEKQPGEISRASDQPLADYQQELLDLAFETASAIPVEPHIKDRSKTQEAVVVACLELDQPRRARTYTEKIDNWRRGSCYADLALYCAQAGFAEQAQQYIELAEPIAEKAEDWRRDRIRVKIAQTLTVLGQAEKAGQFETDVVDSEKGKVARVKAMRGDEDSFEAQMKALDALVTSENFDITKNALRAYAQLYDRFYENTARRDRIADTIRNSWGKMPIFIRIELLMSLSESASDHSDKSNGLALVNEAQDLMDDYQWRPEHRIPYTAKLVELRFRAGDEEQAKANAEAALALFKEHREKIVNIWRAGALRPLAKAHKSIGDEETALSVYKQAVEEGIANPNSRPRAEDLSATCAAMAVCQVEPDKELWAKIRKIKAGLQHPW